MKNAEKNECDLIVPGSYRNITGKTNIGNITKGVLKKSSIPVTIAPGIESED